MIPIEMEELGLDQPCICSYVRKTDRYLSQFYDAYLAPAHLKTTPLSLLKGVIRNKDCSITELGKILLMDQTTVTRNAAVLEKRGLLSIEKRSDDARQKILKVTHQGLQKIKEATPYWRQAQQTLQDSLGKKQFDFLIQILFSLQKKL
ncbi:MarR family transcriptional regulator [Sporolactobacillus shoreae]|uniref:MarR family transcriptional regulator n=1 Tax=Sporolactobacillus shoreae TaxID=1465501 RepID=A0A4Z0GJ95_9BACL|nr:MarR family winged helix-turn-helix transcriptional regulator [Sporolactobacillus shoreae]TGA96042.1 MarR family transcriptional regulator [Sporolactobacillus shoreae]